MKGKYEAGEKGENFERCYLEFLKITTESLFNVL